MKSHVRGFLHPPTSPYASYSFGKPPTKARAVTKTLHHATHPNRKPGKFINPPDAIGYVGYT